MKKTFPGYYEPSKDEFDKMWEECIFILDANVLLNLYRYTEATREKLIQILRDKRISDRLWIPYQAAHEYLENRLGVIDEQERAYESIKEKLEKAQNQLENDLGAYSKHPYVSVKELVGKVKQLCRRLSKKLATQERDHPKLREKDTIMETITNLFEGKIGREYTLEELNKIYSTGKERFERDIPPGYKDEKPKSHTERQYGDFVIWFQIIEHAKKMKKPVIFVTDDRKDDWWKKFRGETVGPRPELVQEMKSEANIPFYMYQADRFIERAGQYVQQEIAEEVLQEVKEVAEAEQAKQRQISIQLSKEDLKGLVSPELVRWLKKRRQRPPAVSTIGQYLQRNPAARSILEQLRSRVHPTVGEAEDSGQGTPPDLTEESELDEEA